VSVKTLQTPRLALEPLVEAHADALYPLLCDARQLEFIDRGAPESLQALRRGYRKLESRRSPDGTERWLNWAIIVRGEGGADAIGFVQATVLADCRAWVAYQVGVPWWGRGIGAEATWAMVEHLTEEHGVTAFMATVDRRNARSCRLLERLGFMRSDEVDAVAMEVAPGDWLFRLTVCEFKLRSV
jgi:[ribosomal protein S5]-alanine N-acetyltransferase